MLDVAEAREVRYYGGMPKFGDPDKLSASDAQKQLGVSKWKFFDLVKRGILERQTDDGIYERGYYWRADVDALEKRMKQARKKQPDTESKPPSTP